MSLRQLVTALMLPALASAQALAAGHEDITVLPLGTVEIKVGEQEGSYRLPYGPQGPRRQALVLVAAQPTIAQDAPPVTDPQAMDEQNQMRAPVPATIRVWAADTELPPWSLQPFRTAYVINLETLRASPDYGRGRIRLKLALETEAESCSIVLLGMPDPLLLDERTNGPLENLADAAKKLPDKQDAARYLSALFDEFAGQPDAAKAGYEAVARSTTDAHAARLARRGLRMISYLTRERKLSGNWLEHYRWGLCLQFWGLFDPAFREFDECRIIMPERGDAQYRAAECVEMIGATPLQYALYMDRTGEAEKAEHPAFWQTIVTILRNRDDTPLSIEQNHGIRDACLFADKMLWGATDSRLWPLTSYFEVENVEKQAYVEHPGGVAGPADDLVTERGWYDVVISARPRLADENARDVRVIGGDAGPNGAALISLYHDAGWFGHIRGWYALAYEMAKLNEQERGLPSPDDAIDCGPAPVLNAGYALRSALRYHVNGDHIRGWDIAETPVAGTYLQLWQLEGPFAVAASGDGAMTSHVAEPLSGKPQKTVRIVSEEDFIDLSAIFPNAGHAIARGTTWVFCPSDQEVRIRFGRNDVLAAKLNGAWLTRGTTPARHKFEDRNMVDTLFRMATLRKGWNTLEVIVEGWPAPLNKGWGFSVSVVGADGEPVPGLASLHTRPDADVVAPVEPVRGGKGRYFDWDEVKRDRRMLLPELSLDDLRAITGERGLNVISRARPFSGFVAVDVAGRKDSSMWRAVPANWEDARDRDVRLNNVMDWSREAMMAVRYEANDQYRDLLFVKPEAIEAVVQCLHEPKRTDPALADRPASKRIMGYVVIPVGQSQRVLFVVDAQIGDGNGYPSEEEDLLTPFGPFVPNWPDQFKDDAASQGVPAATQASS